MKNSIVELEIIDVAFGGAGVARKEGKVFFVPFTAPGDRIRAEVTRDKKKFAEARILEILTPSPDRENPQCLYFGKCGGCAYQHLSYPRQLQIKHSQVEQTLKRIGRFESVPMRPIIASSQTYGFRNRIRVHVQDGFAGFFEHGSHTLVPIARCEIAQPSVNEALHDLRRRAARDGDYTVSAKNRGEFFEQTNDVVGMELLSLVEKEITPTRSVLIDAYCGAGFFARHLSARFATVIGIEENENAIHEARRKAAPHERYLVGDVATHLGEILASHDPLSAVVILDPPATGLDPRVVDILLAAPPAEILYVSCNPATLARDLALLAKGQLLESITPLDMFPQTADIEVLAVMRQR